MDINSFDLIKPLIPVFVSNGAAFFKETVAIYINKGMMKHYIYAGCCLGLLTGTIIGLSISEVTGIILGFLTSFMSGYFVVTATRENDSGKQVLIGTFCLACFFSILFGIYARTHNILAPTLPERLERLKVLSLNATELKGLILFEEFGFLPEDLKESETGKNTGKTILMADDEENLSICNEIDANSSLQKIKKVYAESGLKTAQLEEALSLAIDDSLKLKKSLLDIKAILCKK